MQTAAEIMDNQYVYWIITGIVGGIFSLLIGALIWFLKRQFDRYEARFVAIEKRAEQDRKELAEQYDKRLSRIEDRAEQDRKELSTVLKELPITYTLREEFLRVTTSQNSKLDKITDMIVDMNGTIAGICGRKD